jgi:hypothetical protein
MTLPQQGTERATQSLCGSLVVRRWAQVCLLLQVGDGAPHPQTRPAPQCPVMTVAPAGDDFVVHTAVMYSAG